MSDCSFTNNTGTEGGGIHVYSSGYFANRITFTGNSGSSGGAIYSGKYSGVTLNDCSIISNNAYYGGAISGEEGTMMLTNVTMNGNIGVYGGAISCRIQTQTTLYGCYLGFNQAKNGGGLYLSSASKGYIFDTTIQNNTATENGGGVYCDESDMNITNTIITGNWADPSTTYDANMFCGSPKAFSRCRMDGDPEWGLKCPIVPDGLFSNMTLYVVIAAGGLILFIILLFVGLLLLKKYKYSKVRPADVTDDSQHVWSALPGGEEDEENTILQDEAAPESNDQEDTLGYKDDESDNTTAKKNEDDGTKLQNEDGIPSNNDTAVN